MKKAIVRMTESDIRDIIKETAEKLIREGYHSDLEDAERNFERIREFYQGNEDMLIGFLWYFLGGDKPNFIKYMETSGNLHGMDDKE